MLKRQDYLNQIDKLFKTNPICALLGPRQCGKTTLSKQYIKNISSAIHYFDLEDPTDLSMLENPKLALEPLEGLIVIDEIQRRPELFSYLRVFVDNFPDRRILILGSASQELIRQSSESLAGRIAYIEMSPFNLKEVEDNTKLWSRGGFPRSYLAKNEDDSNVWRRNYIRTFLEKDINNLGFNVSTQTMRRFWQMLAHYHGQVFNASEIGRSIDVTYKTSDRYLDILTGSFMIRRLSPWFENISKRQIKSPKIYFRDSGILHCLLGINSYEELFRHPKIGASWEGMAIEQLITMLQADNEDCYFWATQGGAELDLLVLRGSDKLGFEIKYTDSPKITKSMNSAIKDLNLKFLTVIIPGNKSFKLADEINVLGINRLNELIL